MTRELTLLVEEAGWDLVDLRDVAVTAAAHSFLHHDERSALIDQVIRPAYASARGGRHRACSDRGRPAPEPGCGPSSRLRSGPSCARRSSSRRTP